MAMKRNIFFLSLILFFKVIASAQNPGEHWMRFKTPEQAGWSKKSVGTRMQIVLYLSTKGKSYTPTATIAGESNVIR